MEIARFYGIHPAEVDKLDYQYIKDMKAYIAHQNMRREADGN